MASNINLSRNTKVYFTTNLNAAGAVLDAIGAATNTWEIQVLDGYSFTQTNQQANVLVTEAGATPSRGGRTFNTQLSPADWSFSTYIRPYLATAVVSPTERVLWNALLGSANMDETGYYSVSAQPTRAVTTAAGASIATATIVNATAAVAPAVGSLINFHGATNFADWNQPAVITTVTGSATTATVVVEFAKAPAAASGLSAVGATKAFVGQWVPSIGTATASQNFAYVSTMGSNKQQLQKFGLIFVVDTVVYALDNCAIDQASIDFGLDAISTIAWTGKSTALRKLTTLTNANIVATAAQPTTANYITNKLSTMTLESNIGGAANTAVATVQYAIPITGGNITIANNLNFLVPNNLGVLNQPIGYYTGERNISGSVTAYLRTGSALSGAGVDAGGLLANMLAATGALAIEPKYRMQIELGGISNATHLEFEMPGVNLMLPAVNVADVVAATITFGAQPFTPDVNGASTPAFDLTRTNDLTVRYYSA